MGPGNIRTQNLVYNNTALVTFTKLGMIRNDRRTVDQHDLGLDNAIWACPVVHFGERERVLSDISVWSMKSLLGK